MKWQFDKFLISDKEQRQKKLALKYVMAGGAFVLALKSYAYFTTFSNAILSDVFESVLNMVACSLSLYGLHYAGKPRDSRHPYGPGKMEFLAAGFEGIIMSLLGAVIAGKAIYNLAVPQGIERIDKGIIFETAGALINLLLGFYLIRRSKKLDSQILNADGRRVLADGYSSAALIAALFIMLVTAWAWLDGVIALISGILIIRTGVKVIRKAVPGLLDRADQATLEEVVKVLYSNSRPGWIDIKNLRSSHYGMYIYVDCHMIMPWYWNLKEVNAQVLDAELIINQHFKQRVDLFVQAEPCKPKDCPMCRVDDCPVRQHPFSGKQPWKLNQMVRNKEIG